MERWPGGYVSAAMRKSDGSMKDWLQLKELQENCRDCITGQKGFSCVGAADAL